MELTYQIIQWLGFFSGVIPLIAIFLNYKYLDGNSKLFSLLILCSFLSELISVIFNLLGYYNIIIINIYTIIEFIIIVLYLLRITKIRISKFFKLIIFSLLVLIQIFILLLNKSVKEMDCNSWIISNSIILVFSFIYLFKLFLEDEVNYLLEFPSFWITIGLITYFGGTLFLFLTISLANNLDNETGFFLWKVNNIFTILANLLFTIGIWKTRKFKNL